MSEVCQHPHVLIPLNFLLERHQRDKITRSSFLRRGSLAKDTFQEMWVFCVGLLAGIIAAGVYKLFET